MFAVDGVNVHTWTAADQVAVSYQLLRRRFRAEGDTTLLRELFELADDKDALAALDREVMGQPRRLETTM